MVRSRARLVRIGTRNALRSSGFVGDGVPGEERKKRST
jgi:hypothetical protein